MRFLVILALLAFPMSAQAFSYSAGGCSSGVGPCATGEQWEAANGNDIDAALDTLETTSASHTSSISTLTGTFASYLPLNGVTTYLGTMTMGGTSSIAVGTGTSIIPTGGTLLATGMLSSGQIDDNDLAAGAVDLNTSEVSGTLPVANGGTGATALTNLITLSTHTAGNYVATIADSGASEVTVSGSGSEGAAVTLAIASTITRDSELAAISAASSTNTAVAKFSGVAGDLQDSGVTIDASNNVVTPGNLGAGGSSGASTIVMRNTIDSGWVECGVVTTTWTCAVDADGTPDGTL